MLDCLIVGAGPAGLTVADCPGYPDRISGDVLLMRLRDQVERCGVTPSHLYSALGAVNRSELAEQAGATVDSARAIIVDAHLQTSILSFYAIGDIAPALNQISVAMGAAIAATAIHNRL